MQRHMEEGYKHQRWRDPRRMPLLTAGRQIFEEMIAVASGKRSKSEPSGGGGGRVRALDHRPGNVTDSRRRATPVARSLGTAKASVRYERWIGLPSGQPLTLSAVAPEKVWRSRHGGATADVVARTALDRLVIELRIFIAARR